MGIPGGPFGGGDWQTPRARRRPFADQPPNVALAGSQFVPADGAYAITIAGVDRTHYVDKYTVEITDDLNEAPNTCAFECFGFTPVGDSQVLITTGTLKEFKGRIKTIAEHHDKLNDRTVYSVTCIDRTFELDQLVTDAYGSQSASTTGSALVTKYGAGFTQSRITAGLPTVAAIQFKMTRLADALRQLADAFGGDTYVDYDDDVHLFITETDVAPATINTANTNWRSLKYQQLFDRIRNQILVEGLGSTTSGDVAVGDTRIPCDSVGMFESTGGKAVIGNQVITYTSRNETAPLSAPYVVTSSGTDLGTGVYQYAYTYVTATGESLPSPLASITTGVSLPPVYAPVWTGGGAFGSLTPSSTYKWAFTWVTPTGETTASPVMTTTLDSVTNVVQMNNFAAGATTNNPVPGGTTSINLYRTVANGSQLKLVANLPLSTLSYLDGLADGSLGVNVPTVNTTVARNASLTLIAVGPTSTTSRKIYRTAVGGSQLKLLTTLADNTTTTLADATADGSLGANVPTTDTSGLVVTGFTTTSGTNAVGATALSVASNSLFSSTGGWVRINDMLVRYTGISGVGLLIGVPSSGAGSITSTVFTGTLVQGVVSLGGIPSSGAGSIAYAITRGAEINLLVQRDDTASQSTYGVRQMSVQDRRLSTAGAQARGDAELSLRKSPYTAGSYITTDRNVRSGRRVTIDMTTWGISGTFTITRVRTFWEPERAAPQREVTFSSKTTDKDLYRVLRELRRETQNAA